MDPEALQFCHRCDCPYLSRGAGDLRYPPRPTHPGGRPLLSGPGAPAGRRLLGPRVRPGDLQGRLREPEAPAARLRVDGRPPSLSGRRAACLRGGEEGAVAPASASRSSPAHAPAIRARARAAPTALLPSPASGSAAGAPVATPVTERPATSPRQPARNPSEKLQDGGTSAADPETLPPPTARLPGV